MTHYPRLLDVQLNEVKRITPIDGSVTLNIIPLSTASLTMKVDEGIKDGDWIEMFTNRGSAGIYRVRSVNNEYSDGVCSVEMDHAISEVGDYVVNAKISESSTFSAALRKLFGYYKGNKWSLVEGSYTDAVVLDVSYTNVLEAMLEIFEQQPQYYLSFSFSPSGWVATVQKRNQTVAAEGRLSRNVLSASITYDDSELYTRIYVEYGSSGKTSYTYYDAEPSAVSTYGRRDYFMSQSGYTEAQARTIALAYLGKHQHPSVAISITGRDLAAVTGEALDTLEIGKLYQLALPKYGIVVRECITTLNWQSIYTSPYDVNVSLADVEDPVVSYIKKTSSGSKSTKKQVDKATQEIYVNIEQTASHIRQDVYTAKSDLYSTIMQTATNIYSHVGNVKDDLHSEIEQTASYIRADVYAAKSTLYSTIMQTATNIYAHVGNVKSDLHSEIEQTASYIRQDVYAAKSTLYSSIMQTATNIYTQVGNAKSDMYSQIEQTASYIRADVYAAKSTLYSTIMQTATNIYSEVGNTKSDMYSRIEQTASSITSTVGAAKSTLYSSIMQTSTMIYTEVGNAKSGLYSSIEQTASQIKLKANKVWVDGELEGLTAKFNSITVEEGSATYLQSGKVYATKSLHVGWGSQGGGGTIYYRGTAYYPNFVVLKDSGGHNISEGTVLGTGNASSSLDMTHYHDITVEQGTGTDAGKLIVTLGKPSSSAGSANFNIADTQIYKDGVSAAKNSVKVKAFTANSVTLMASHRTFTYTTNATNPVSGAAQVDTWHLVPATSWSSGSKTVYMRYGSTTGTVYAQVSVTIAKSDITIPTSWTSSSTDPDADVLVNINKNYTYHKATINVGGRTKTVRLKLIS